MIEDDADDPELLKEAFNKLNYQNKVLFFSDGQEALEHINTSEELPFLILSDINLPKLNGFALLEKLKTDAKLGNKCIRTYFSQLHQSNKQSLMRIANLYKRFFKKPNSIAEFERPSVGLYWVPEKMCGT